MLVSVVAIGNSKGIRIPKAILEPVRGAPRKTWAGAFREMAEHGDGTLVIADELDSEMDDCSRLSHSS